MFLKPDADQLTLDHWSTLAAETHRGMAHFAGTGPRGKTCTECRFRVEVRSRKFIRCHKFRTLTGKTGETFPTATEACKYFKAGKP